MHKFKIEAEFSLTTTVEPDGVSFSEGDSEDFSDDSYFQSESVTSSGGQLSFVVEADNESEAESLAGEIVSEGDEVTDYNGLTWEIDGVYFNVERISEPMTLERATAILQTLASDFDGDNADEVAEAISFILAALAKLTAEVTNLKAVSEANAITPSVTL